MKVCGVADLHGRLPNNLPACDVLVLPGDVAPHYDDDPGLNHLRQFAWYLEEFAPWEATVPAEHILMTPGNHDLREQATRWSTDQAAN